MENQVKIKADQQAARYGPRQHSGIGSLAQQGGDPGKSIPFRHAQQGQGP